jgi:hypothetical protein
MNAVARIQFWWKDRDGNEGAIQWYVPSSVAYTDVLGDAIAVAIPRMQALTDAVFQRVVIEYKSSLFSPAEPPEGSTIRRKALLIFQNADEELDALTILSPVSSLYETTGPYAGIRVDPTQLVDLVDMLSSIAFRTKDDRQFGSIFVAGSLAY